MKRGDRVCARVYPTGERVLRVWADAGEGVLLTTDIEYEVAVKEGGEPTTVGFPKNDVRVVDHPNGQS
jgi:hypothetical protein